MSWAESRARRSRLAVDLGLAANAALAVLRLAGGLIAHSPALLADGVNALGDVAYYLVVKLVVGPAQAPADDEHPYGHERLESIGALVVGAFLLATGLGVLVEGLRRVVLLLRADAPAEAAGALALWVASVSIAAKLVLWITTRRLGRSTSNAAVSALAADHLNDVYASLAALAGILASRGGLPWMDPLAAGVVGLFILRSAAGVLRENSSELMGRQLEPSMHERISAWALAVPGVWQIERLRAHRFGPYLVLELTVGVDGDLSVARGDAIADEVERVLHEHIEMLRAVHVHYHPARGGAAAAVEGAP